jgi:Flp pilus assembly pilin Flp
MTNLIRKFHSDEEGLEALQVVMIIAIAAMIMIAAATVGKSGVDWMKDQAGKLVGQDLDSFADGGGDAGGGDAGGGDAGTE